MRTFLRVIAYIIYIPLLALFTFELYRTGVSVYQNYMIYMWFGIGLVSYFVLGLFFRKNREWLQTFSHELTHTLVSIFFFRKIHSFTAERGEGVMTFSGGKFKIGDLMISLSPYFLPIFTIFFLLIRHVVTGEATYIFDFLIGFTFAFHLGCFKAQTGSYQTDISQHGCFFSYIVIFTFLALNISLVLLSIESNLFPAVKEYFVQAWTDLKMAAEWIYINVSALISK